MIQYFSKDENLGKLSMWLFVLTCFSYPITAVPIAISGFASTPINTTIKAIYSLLAIFIILISLFKKNLKFNTASYVLVLFWIIYSIRLVYDISYLGVKLANGSGTSEYFKDTAFQVYSFFFASSLIPAIAILLTAKLIDLNKLPVLLLTFLAIANVEVAIYLIQNIAMVGKDLFAERANIESQTDSGATGVVLNTIYIGYFGQQLVINALSRIIIVRKNSIFLVVVLICLICLGVFNVVVAASRSPFISLTILSIMILGYNFKMNAKSTRYWLSAAITISIIVFLIYAFAMPFIEGKDFAMLNRLTEFQTDRAEGGKEYRDFAYASAINDFLGSPIFGRQFVGTYDNFYPHNFFLEVLMATGLMGGIVMLIIIINISLKAISFFIPQNKAKFVCLLFLLPKLMASMTSGCLFTDPEFWVLLSFFTAL